MKHCILYLLFVVMSVTTATAQIKGGAGFFKTGYLNAPRSSSFLAKIDAGGAASFTNHYMLMGIEAYYRTGNFIITWEGYSAQQSNYSLETDYSVEPFIAVTQLKLGRVIKQNRQYWLYPSVGAGTSAFFLYPCDKANEKFSNPRNLTLITPSFDLGINADFLLSKINSADKKHGGMLLGLRTGYRFSFLSDGWRDNSRNKVTNLPAYENKGFYLTIGVGAGSFTKK